ncbi:MAG: deoxyhypusine synthase family protein [Synergistaceae bacterium]|nr:deoxyhypusine synthase family protein [Synergistaceae bacterium]MBQ3345468.1 deoxyhypusine synthase family protein [Synergistaceae bacterium]MBQ3758128.1 deoxyhypusine synthase family protein [Synergistaceae bacterium]MBQ4401164.1 deoxyhypusine synthase family protein [Synergistaceae bacterium]MBQ6417530.1 deoxyhypusine synthase family protein [Synergistaceae bacterium]
MLFGLPQLDYFRNSLDERSKEALSLAVERLTDAKKHGRKVMIVTGSGPNIHEGVTTLIAELIRAGLVDAVSTSSAVIAHEMAGSLDRVFRVDAKSLGMDMSKMPRGDVFEFTCMNDDELDALEHEMPLDDALLERGKNLPHVNEIIKAAGNMAYPMGLRTERLAHEVLSLARIYGLPFETVAGWGCDEHTMLGAASRRNVPVLVTIPQLVGGGAVGMSIGDSIPVSERSMRISRMLADCDVIIESAVALTQEIHDGPFECYTGHGIWAWWSGQNTYNLRDKTLIRIDLDENLRRATELNKTVQEAIDKGLPKTKAAKIPFRMEMSAFARHEGSIPIVGDIGKVWPLIAHDVAENLGVKLEFLSASQDTPEGQKMRDWIVDNVKPLDRQKMLERSESYVK